MDRNSAEVAFHALGRIFWGALICAVDIHFSVVSSGQGFKFDVVNDVIGALLIAWGLGPLQPLVFDLHYARVMSFCRIVAAVSVVDAIVGHAIFPWPVPFRGAYAIWSLVSLFAVYRFCSAMRIFCFSAGVFDTERTWATSERLVFWLVLVPGAAIQVLGLLGSGAPISEKAALAPLALAAAIAAAIALIHVLLSISRTRTALREAAHGRFLP